MSKSITAFHLKLIAIVAMFISHIGDGFFWSLTNPNAFLMTEIIGKLTFPIMAFLLVEGYHYSRNRWQYAGRLLIFGVLSIIPFHQLFLPGTPLLMPWMNILFTLSWGLLLIAILDRVKQPLLQLPICLLFSYLSYYSDWYLFGVLAIAGFYKCRQLAYGYIYPILFLAIAYPIFLYVQYQGLQQPLPVTEWIDSLAVVLVIPLLMAYKGQRGPNPTWLKWGFYAFYPLHLTALWLIRLAIMGI